MREPASGPDEPPREAIEIVVTDAEAGQRLDRVLVARVPGMTRRAATELVAAGSVRVDGRRPKKGAPVASGQRITLTELPRPRDFAARPDRAIPLEVLHEDARVVVVNKPAGVPTHPLREDELGTMANALLARYPEMASVGHSPREPGILHRLDTGTSGALLAARDARAFEALRRALAEGRIDKRYVALVSGQIEAPMTIDAAIAKDKKRARRVRVLADDSGEGRPARTEILAVVPVGRTATRIEVSAPLATRHQIRAHLAFIGHPLIGDAIYGGPSVPELARHLLHASEIAFPHPDDGRVVRVEAPPPPDLEQIRLALDRT